MKEQKFELLSPREERGLTKQELAHYYAELRKYVLNRKLQTTTRGALTISPKLKPFVDKINQSAIKLLAGGAVEYVTDGSENIPSGPIIFANNHQGILDNFCWTIGNPRHSILLHGSDTGKLLILAQCANGLVLVAKNDPHATKNRTDAKLDMIHILLKGHCIWYFPEGTWNMSPNKLHLPMSYGFLEIAKKSGAPVVPVATEFTRDTSTEKERITKIHIRYGKPIYVSLSDDLGEKLEEYLEALSTLRWELIEAKGLHSRKNMSNEDYVNYLKGVYNALDMKNPKLSGKEMGDIERRSIRGASDDYYLFHHINDIPFNEKGELMETAEMIRLNRLFEQHILGL